MSDLYKTVCCLCEQKGVSGGKLHIELGMSKSFMTELKSRKAKSIKIDTAQKLANVLEITL